MSALESQKSETQSVQKLEMPTEITKRDGRVTKFDITLIENALKKCFEGIKKTLTPEKSQSLSRQVANIVSAKYVRPTVENVQDVVETVLQANGEYEAAKAYILYRAEHAKQRSLRPIPDSVREAFDAADVYFPTPIQKFQFYDKYSRFDYNLGRRETWIETVDRAMAYLKDLSKNKLDDNDYQKLRNAILEMKVMPSMRLLAMAGPAAERNNISIYNCSYMPVDSMDSFVEALLISMSGCGVGYSVEREYIEKFPRIQRQKGLPIDKYYVEDSTQGWADALRHGLSKWFAGHDVEFDYSNIRPAGAVLRIKGGRASGPEPLRVMLDFARERILKRQGSFLRSLDAHDIMCAVGSAAVSGGVRRTAMISLFDYDDSEMRHCKDGDFWRTNNQRWNANNSAVWPDRELTQAEVAQYLLDMNNSMRGEPGIFNRKAAISTRPERRSEARFGTNPCGEIILRPFEFCNLSVAVARPDDTEQTLAEKVELATMVGTIQSMATHFPGLRDEWRKNCEEERLLGVDINGQLDSKIVQDATVQKRMQQIAIEANKKYATKLGINQSVSVTCVKPSGNSSQLLNCSSGIHPRWADYYIRNIRVGAHTPLYKVMKDAGVPMDPENGQNEENANTFVIHFPVKSPENAVTRKKRTAMQQANYWLQCKTHYTEHNPSVTITYQPNELLEIINWVWKNQDKIGGITFLPADDAQFDQMPYVEINKDEYEKLASKFPDVDFSKIYRYESEDYTTAAQELACVGGNCDMQL